MTKILSYSPVYTVPIWHSVYFKISVADFFSVHHENLSLISAAEDSPSKSSKCGNKRGGWNRFEAGEQDLPSVFQGTVTVWLV